MFSASLSSKAPPMSLPPVFTIDAANERLPYVRTIVHDIVTLAADLQQRQERLDDIRHLQEQGAGESPHSEEIEQMQQAVDQDFVRFEELEKELSLVDVQVVDRMTGLVEMRSQLHQQPVWLNWLPEDLEFIYWRSEDDDPMQRRPMLERVSGGHSDFTEGPEFADGGDKER